MDAVSQRRFVMSGQLENITSGASSTETRNQRGELTALFEGTTTEITILTREGEKNICYKGQIPKDAKGHRVEIYEEEAPEYGRIRRRTNPDIETDCPIQIPKRIRIHDVDTNEWYS